MGNLPLFLCGVDTSVVYDTNARAQFPPHFLDRLGNQPGAKFLLPPKI